MVTEIAAPDRYGRLSEIAFAIPTETLCPLRQPELECLQPEGRQPRLAQVRADSPVSPDLRAEYRTGLCSHDREAATASEGPYRGLHYFDVRHAPFFFGREAETDWLLDELRPPIGRRVKNRLLAIIGPSGSGKSSLARAGLIAALKRGEIEGSSEWPIIICRPGNDLLESLAIALLSESSDVSHKTSPIYDLIENLLSDKRTLHLCTRLKLRDSPPERRLVILVDQFEEAFTLCQDDAPRQALIENLVYAANVPSGQTWVLLTLRADFYGWCAAYPTLAASLSDRQVLVGPMLQDQLRRAIEQPAHLLGYQFEAGLLDMLLRDMRNQAGCLPLLQYALQELWERRQGQQLTHSAYRAIGRVEGALDRQAETVFNCFDEVQQQVCRRVFLRLTQPGEGTEDTARRVPFHELIPATGERETVEGVVRLLAGAHARLITIEGSEGPEDKQFVEVAHEALIQGWSRLREWIEQDRESLHIHRRLTEAARDWNDNNRDRSYLHRGVRLIEADEWATSHTDDINELERAFLDAGLAQREVETREQEEQRRKEEQLLAEQRMARQLRQLNEQLEQEIAERRQVEQALREYAAQLEALDQKRFETISTVSHELRACLTPIKSYLENTLSGLYGPVSSKQYSRLQLALASVDEEARLVENQLDLVRIGEGRTVVHLEYGNVADIVESVIQGFRYDADRKHIELRENLGPKGQLWTQLDRGKIKQVVTNLLSNAIKFTPERGIVVISTSSDQEWIEVRIEDTGIGISADEQERIFDRFYRVDSPLTRKESGVGIGLSIVKEYVEMHGGSVRVQSRLDQGSIFTFTLPKREEGEASG